MSEQRFTIQKASGMYIHLPIFDNSVEMADGDVCILLNEQQSTISTLEEENDILKQKLRKNYIANKQYEEMKRLQKENKKLKEDKKILDYIKKRHNCSNCVKALESNKTMKRYYYCLKHYKEVTENDICENYRYWR